MTAKPTVYWLTDDGQIESYNESVDDDGKVYAFTGSPPPKGAKVLDSEGIARIFRDRYKAEEKMWAERQKQNRSAIDAAASEREAKVATLKAAGLPDEAIEIIIPPIPPFTERPFVAPVEVQANLLAFGLSTDQIQRVLGGWG